MENKKWILFLFGILIIPFFIQIFVARSKVFAAGLTGDVNNDGEVNIIDVGVIIDNYGKTPVLNPAADLNSDGQVNIIDIGIVIDNYGKTLTASPTPGGLASYVVVAVGDMVCGSADSGMGYPCQALANTNLISQIKPSSVIALGDNQYESGSLGDFNAFYNPTFGIFKDITDPVPGNHEYDVSGANGYYTYFGSSASPQDSGCKSNCKGYYSYNIGNWHIIALNSECANIPGGCGSGSPQENWLKNDLANVTVGKCILAYWHEPHYSSGHDGNTSIAARSLPFWQDLYAAHADIVLNGHSHNYERFNLQDAGSKSDINGIRQFVVGTGGRDFTGWWTSNLVNSQIKNNNTFGVLKLTLNSSSYDWQFIPSIGVNGYKNGTFTDSGSTQCH